MKTDGVLGISNKNPHMNLKGEFADSSKTSKMGLSFNLMGLTLYNIANKIKRPCQHNHLKDNFLKISD